MEKLRGYGSWSVITTCTTENLPYLSQTVDLFHAFEVPTCMLNTLRCTLPGARGVKPADADMAKAFFAALDRTHELYKTTGRKLLVALIAEARRLNKHVMVAGIESQNHASLHLHETLGFITTGQMPQVGTKFGRWLDLTFMQLQLDARQDPDGKA